MRSISLHDAEDQLAALVDEVNTTREVIEIRKQGRAVAVLIGADELESLQETLFWLAQPCDVLAEVDRAREELATGRTISGDSLRLDWRARGRPQ